MVGGGRRSINSLISSREVKESINGWGIGSGGSLSGPKRIWEAEQVFRRATATRQTSQKM